MKPRYPPSSRNDSPRPCCGPCLLPCGLAIQRSRGLRCHPARRTGWADQGIGPQNPASRDGLVFDNADTRGFHLPQMFLIRLSAKLMRQTGCDSPRICCAEPRISTSCGGRSARLVSACVVSAPSNVGLQNSSFRGRNSSSIPTACSESL